MLDASQAAQDLVQSYNGAAVSTQSIENAQNAAKASTIGLALAQGVLNSAIGMGVGLLVNFVVNGINNMIHANERAIESAQKLRSEYQESRDTTLGNLQTIQGLKSEFDELSQHVGRHGENIDASAEQYERYKEIVQKIISIAPSLAEGYDLENGYIADKNGLLERAAELQEREYRNNLNQATSLDSLKKSMKGYVAEYKESFNGASASGDGSIFTTDEGKDFENALFDAYNRPLTFNAHDNEPLQENVAEKVLAALHGEDADNIMRSYYDKHGFFEYHRFRSDYADKIASNIDAITGSLSQENTGLGEEDFKKNILALQDSAKEYLRRKESVRQSGESMQKDLGLIAESANGYTDLSPGQRAFVSGYLKGFSITDVISEDRAGTLDYDDQKMKDLRLQILNFVNTLFQDPATQDAIDRLFTPQEEGQAFDQYMRQFTQAYEQVKAFCAENEIEIPASIQLAKDDADDLQKLRRDAIGAAKKKFGGGDPSGFFDQYSVNTPEEFAAWQTAMDKSSSLAAAKRSYVDSLPGQDALPFDGALGQVEDLSHGLEQLGKIYADVLDKGDFDWSSILNNKDFKDTFGGFEDEYDAFIKAVSDSPDDIDACQSSFDNLLTAYLYGSGVLDGLSEETKDATIAMLEQSDIANASELVNGRLAATEAFLAERKTNSAVISNNLTDATWREIGAVVAEGDASEETKAYLALLALSKLDFSTNPINSEADINAIIALEKGMPGDTGTAKSDTSDFYANAGPGKSASSTGSNPGTGEDADGRLRGEGHARVLIPGQRDAKAPCQSPRSADAAAADRASMRFCCSPGHPCPWAAVSHRAPKHP